MLGLDRNTWNNAIKNNLFLVEKKTWYNLTVDKSSQEKKTTEKNEYKMNIQWTQLNNPMWVDMPLK